MNDIAPKPLKKRSGRKRSFMSGQAKKVKEHLFSETAIKCICTFLLSRTSLIGGAAPLGFSFFAANFSQSATYPCAVSLILGLIFSGKGILTVGKYIIAITLFSLIRERFLPEKYKSSGVSSVLASFSLLFSGTFLLFADITFGGYPLLYDSMVLIIECATLWLFSRAFSIVLGIYSNFFIRRSLSAEETVSIALFTGGVLCGFGEAGIGGFFSLTGTLCVFFVLLFALRFGALEGSCAGIVMGIVYCLSRGRIDTSAASFALSGLCAGYFSKYGRWSVCISFIIANAVVTILSNGSTQVLINLFDTVIAAVILYSIPRKFFSALGGFSPTSPPAVGFAASKLYGAQATIKNCEKSFQRIFNLRNNSEYNTLLLYRRTARNTCGGCGLRKYCWGRDAKATKESMDKLCANLECGKGATAENAPVHCLRKEQFVNEFSRMFDIYKNDCMWTEKLSEMRTASYTSFSAVSEILGMCANKILGTDECDGIAADTVRSRLRKEGILANEVFVSGRDDETKVQISLDSCGGFGRCEGAVYKILEEIFKKPFIRTGGRSCGNCMCQYVVKPSFSVTTAVASAIKTKKKVSGDHAIYALLDRHTYAMILCDGMGSGEIAREESKTCAKLLLDLISHNIKPETAISIVNSMLLWAFSGSIAAVDLCLINLDDGSSVIYKCGGAGSFAKTKNVVTSISSPTLPAGSFTSSDTEVFSVASEKGSMLVMVSDGVISAEGRHKPWIQEMIDNYDGNEPEELSQMILSKAKEISVNAEDDLTVMATYIG